MQYAIEINNLIKDYDNIRAVNDISFTVNKGDFFAFLGENGAGKSTTINVLNTLLEKTSGKIFVDGFEVGKSNQKIRERIGIVFQNSVLDEDLSVMQNLKVRASYYGICGKAFNEKLKELSDTLELEEILKRKIKTLSGGQKRKVDIARGLINSPSILFLDEPTTGIDPSFRNVIWKFIKEIRDKYKTTIFLTTHYMEEANNSDNIVIIEKGKIIANDTPINLKNKYAKDLLKIYKEKSTEFEKLLTANKYKFNYVNNCYILELNSEKAKAVLNKFDNEIGDFEFIKGTLDSVFINLVKGKSNE